MVGNVERRQLQRLTEIAFSAEELAFLDRCYARFNLLPEYHVPLVTLYWLNAVSSQLDLWFATDATFLRTRILDVVEAITGIVVTQ